MSDEAPAEEPTIEEAAPTDRSGDLDLFKSFFFGISDELTTKVASNAIKAARATIRTGSALLRPENLERMAEAGHSLRDAREVAGLTIKELSEALDLEDEGLLEAVEKGTATLSFELVLRLASLLARHDPVPFVMRYTRTYNPTVWKALNDWGVGRIPLQYERERQFINIYRRHDVARSLSDEEFNHLLKFTERAFELGLEQLSSALQMKEKLKEEEKALAERKTELERRQKALEEQEKALMERAAQMAEAREEASE